MAISRQQLFSRLSKLGLSERSVRAYLPGWMTDEAIDSPSGLTHLKILLVREFGLAADALFSKEEAVRFQQLGQVSFKRSVNLSQDQLTPATAVVTSAIRHVLSASKFQYQAPASANQVREWIFANGGDRVTLRGVLFFSVHHGIPILPIRTLPADLVKMDGLVAAPNGLPAIAIARRSPFQAWQAFIVAHELGHIHAGHVSAGRMLVEESFGQESFGNDSKDAEEQTANSYALQLLGGDIRDDENLFGDIDGASDLAKAAMNFQKTRQVDAGHLILRHAYRTKKWRLCIAALQRLDANPGAADEELSQAFVQSIDINLLPKESQTFLEQITDISIAK